MTIEKGFEGGAIVTDGEMPFICRECGLSSGPTQKNHIQKEERHGKEYIAYNCPNCGNTLFRLFIDD